MSYQFPMPGFLYCIGQNMSWGVERAHCTFRPYISRLGRCESQPSVVTMVPTPDLELVNL